MPIIEGVEFASTAPLALIDQLIEQARTLGGPDCVYAVAIPEIRAAIFHPVPGRDGEGVFLRIAPTAHGASVLWKDNVPAGKLRLLNDSTFAAISADIPIWYEEVKDSLKRTQGSIRGIVRNPKWTRDELILALDLYFRTPPWTISGKHPDVIALSKELGTLAAYTDAPDKLRYRNPNGVYMKLMNLQFHDPSRDGRGLKDGGALEKEIWEEFGSDLTKLTKVATAIRAGANSEELRDTDRWLAAEDQAVEEAVEGRVLTRMHQVRERNSKLPGQKKKHVLKTTGTLSCEGCQFDFRLFYGDHAGYYAEVHHLTPLSELPEHTTTKLSELAVVCSNCHRMIHRRKRWLTMQELRDIIQQARVVKAV